MGKYPFARGVPDRPLWWGTVGYQENGRKETIPGQSQNDRRGSIATITEACCEKELGEKMEWNVLGAVFMRRSR